MTKDTSITLTKRQARLVRRLIDLWQERGLVEPETARALQGGFEVTPFNWRRLARLSLLVSALCLGVAVVELAIDQALVRLLERLFQQPDWMRAVFFAVVAVGLYGYGFRRRRTRPETPFSNETLLFLGSLAMAASVVFLGRSLDDGSGHFSLIMLLACAAYGAIAFFGRSTLVWVFSIFSLGVWFGAETGYLSGWGTYYFGMNYPLRFLLFSAVLLMAASAMPRIPRLNRFTRPTLAMGLLYGFLTLWTLSIFGNYGDLEAWRQVRQVELVQWSLLFGLASAAAIWHGLKYDDGMTWGFGIVFLGINLYTRFFEFFWDSLHKALFFAILAASLWALGTRAERIWTLGRRRATPLSDDTEA